MDFIKKIIKTIFWGYHGTSEGYISHLRKKGIKVGTECVFWNSHRITIDEAHPYMLEIGNRVNITGDVTILCHDYSSIAARNCMCGGGGVRKH